MAKNNNLTDFLTDVANAIRTKKGITGTINPQNFSSEIASISTGVDTFDATATAADILSGKTAYVNGTKVVGTIATYDGTVEDVVYADCITFTGETSEFTLKATYKSWDGTLEWSNDHNTWTTLTGTGAMQSVDKKLYLRGKNTTFYADTGGVRWQLSARAGCSGNIQTLLDWENPPTVISTTSCYKYMFLGCTNLTTPPELPATTLTTGCYSSMFDRCTNLTHAPKLPATTLALACYATMFNRCTSLTLAPELPATTLAINCYNGMFSGCTSLTSAPTLSATTLANYCCRSMFNRCTSLTSAPELPATTLKEGCYMEMFNGCTSLKVNISSGNKIFTCPSTISDYSVNNMFNGTGGSFTGTPTAGTTYYYTD